MPDNWKDVVGGHDAIYFGAAGWPALVPDHVSRWDSLIRFRRDFDPYVNLRLCQWKTLGARRAMTENGFYVINALDTLSLADIAARREDMVSRGQAGKLRPADIQGGGFTISNLGMYGVDAFNAIEEPLALLV
jgi:2-oxoacid dehydrogenases acyltransferase (catalytic domain)